MSLDKHRLLFFLSLIFSLHIYITGYGASRTSVDFGSFGVSVIQASVLTRHPLASYFIDYANVLALASMYFISCSISFTVLCYAWPTLRGRWTCWTWDHCFYITTWHYFRPVSMCYHLSYVYHLATVLSSNHLPCHYLARPFYYVMTYLTTIHS